MIPEIATPTPMTSVQQGLYTHKPSFFFGPLSCQHLLVLCSAGFFRLSTMDLSFFDLDFLCMCVLALCAPLFLFVTVLTATDLQQGSRKCQNEGCSRLLASLSSDPHSDCAECRGSNCSPARKCSVCESLSPEAFNPQLPFYGYLVS